MTENGTKEQIGGFLGILLEILGTSLLGNMLVGNEAISAGAGTITAGQDF